jgi:hypothetical protein
LAAPSPESDIVIRSIALLPLVPPVLSYRRVTFSVLSVVPQFSTDVFPKPCGLCPFYAC